MKKYFGFMDETGVLSAASDQRFFALGLLRVENTATLYEQLVILKSRAQDKLYQESLNRGRTPPKRLFEFKFSSITKASHTYYYDLIDLFCQHTDISFCSLVLDKENPNLDVSKYFNNTWDAYIAYAKVLVQKYATKTENLCLVADYLGKPKASPKYFETELTYLPHVYNVCMLESHASLYVQLVDVLIGCVVNNFKNVREKPGKVDIFKVKVSEFLMKKLKRENLAENFTVHQPNYFSVWEFQTQ